MVCSRCKMAVKSVLEKVGLNPIRIELGEVELVGNDLSGKKDELLSELRAIGFDLLDDKKTKTIEKIKNRIVDLVHYKNNNLKTTLSEYLSQELHQEYSALSHLFTEVEGTSIEKYYIHQKIERVKELLVYDELTLSEIAIQLNYSSTAYLSNQFKKITGLTPSHFKKLKQVKRQQLEDL